MSPDKLFKSRVVDTALNASGKGIPLDYVLTPEVGDEREKLLTAVRERLDIVLSHESKDENPRLETFKMLYFQILEDDRKKVSWNEARERLLENNAFKLKAAEALEECVIFGVDEHNRLLFADGLKNITDMKEFIGLIYSEARDRVIYERDQDGEFIEQDEERIRTGHELFPYGTNWRHFHESPEIRAFCNFTGVRFVNSWQEWPPPCSWLESGDDPKRPCLFRYRPKSWYINTEKHIRTSAYSSCGVRRLLRV